MVRPLNEIDRRFCFEVISPTKSHVLQADSEKLYQEPTILLNTVNAFYLVLMQYSFSFPPFHPPLNLHFFSPAAISQITIVFCIIYIPGIKIKFGPVLDDQPAAGNLLGAARGHGTGDRIKLQAHMHRVGKTR